MIVLFWVLQALLASVLLVPIAIVVIGGSEGFQEFAEWIIGFFAWVGVASFVAHALRRSGRVGGGVLILAGRSGAVRAACLGAGLSSARALTAKPPLGDRARSGLDASVMFFSFVDELRAAGIPASMKEHLVLLEALDAEVIRATPEQFYYLARAIFVKDEGLLDRFDQVFAKVFKGIETSYGTEETPIPEEWLKAVAELYLTPEQMAEIKALGSWEEIMETLKQRLEEQQGRHQGGIEVDRHRRHLAVRQFGLQSRKASGSAARAASGARSRSGTSASSATSTIRSNWAPATSRSRSGACAASPAKARRRSSTWTRRSTAPRARAGSTSRCGPSGTMR